MQKSNHILLIETSGDVCSVALASLEEVIDTSETYEKNSHSKYLAPMVHDLLERNQLKPNQLNAIALSHGPGSYTGLRIGASFCKALCYSLEIPLISISSLQSIAVELTSRSTDHNALVAMIDARRMDAYIGIYTKTLETIEEGFHTLSSELLSGLDDKKVLIAGTASLKFKENFAKENMSFEQIELKASFMHPIAVEKYLKGNFEDIAYYEPNYIKSVHITAKKQTQFN